MQTDDLDTLLTMSDPARDLSSGERRAVAEMVDRSRTTKRRRRLARPIAAGAITAVLLGGGAIAAAAATGFWEGWAQNDALAILHYELPSGASCEWRIGGVLEAPDEVDEVIHDALANVEIAESEIVAGAAHVDVAGDPLTDDHAYETGYTWAVLLRIEEALVAHGLDDQWSNIGGQGLCQ